MKGDFMLYFENDYALGAHEKVLQALIETNGVYQSGYGTDEYSLLAKEKIRSAFSCPDADIYFIAGGTQTNALVIDYVLKSYEGVISVDTGHIATHEAGAIEYTGHKVLTLNNKNGKLAANDLKQYLLDFYGDKNNGHMVKPGMVYITHPTEYGTLYTKAELENISSICKSYDLPLFLDGARLGYGLVADNTDILPSDIATYCDIFYIGGTKVGALCGEALVFSHQKAPMFATFIKQHGALLAKGRLIGAQFDALFTDNLYFDIAKSAVELAIQLKNGLLEKGYRLYIDSPTNQQFFIIENSKLENISQFVKYAFWEKYDDKHTVIRLATAWYTTKEAVEKLLELL